MRSSFQISNFIMVTSLIPRVSCGYCQKQNQMKFTIWQLKVMFRYTLKMGVMIAHINSGADIGIRPHPPPPPPSGIRPPADPKGPPFDTFSEIHFWPTNPKIFLKAPLAPIYNYFEGESAPKKARLFCQNFSKSAQKLLF